MKIGELAKRTNTPIETIRYYESLRLILPKQRSDAGYRYYDEEAITILDFIHRTKALGFSLKEIKGLIYLRFESEGNCEEVKAITIQKLEMVEEKIKDLKQIAKQLTKLSKLCDGTEESQECSIFKTFK